MIQLTCTNCKTVLSIDDAFAGGVCRCQHCGTIQTVPAAASAKSRPATPMAASPAPAVQTPQAPPQPRALYRTRPAQVPGAGTNIPSSDLNELAQAVQSSGLTGTGLQSGRLRKPPAEETKPQAKSSRMPVPLPWILGGAAALVIILLVVIIIIVANHTGPSPSNNTAQPANDADTTSNTNQGTSAVPQVAHDNSGPPIDPVLQLRTPNFMGIPLTGPSVVYLLDRGSGTVDTFDTIKGATVKSLQLLGTDKKYQVIFWEVRGKIDASPETSLADATPDHVGKTLQVMKDMFADGASSIEHPLEHALMQNPAEIVIVSGKEGLDDDFVSTVLRARGNSAVKIHAVCLGANSSAAAMKSIAEKTGGQFKMIEGRLLRDFAQFSVN